MTLWMSGIGPGALYGGEVGIWVFFSCLGPQCASEICTFPSTVSINDARYKDERRVVGRGVRRN